MAKYLKGGSEYDAFQLTHDMVFNRSFPPMVTVRSQVWEKDRLVPKDMRINKGPFQEYLLEVNDWIVTDQNGEVTVWKSEAFALNFSLV